MNLADIRLDQNAFDIFAQASEALDSFPVRSELRELNRDSVYSMARDLRFNFKSRLQEAIALTASQQGTLIPALRSPERKQALSTAWALLKAVDWACDDFGLLRWGRGIPIALSKRLELSGRLNTTGLTLVLPKGCSTKGSSHIIIRDLENICWVPAGSGGLEVDFKVMPGIISPEWNGSEDGLTVGFLRVAKSPDDLIVTGRIEGEQRFYSIYPNPERRSTLREAVDGGIKRLAEAGAHFIILPESVVDEEILACIRDCIRGLKSGLNPIVFAGTRLVDNTRGRKASRCTAFMYRGEFSWHQDKLHPYDIDATRIAEWNLGQGIATGTDTKCHEDVFAERPRVCVRDTPAGRVVILICQDLTEGGDLYQLIEHLGPTHVIVPILDSTAGAFWQRAGAALQSAFVGTTFVSNSHFIHALQSAKSGEANSHPPIAYYNVNLPGMAARYGSNPPPFDIDDYLFK